jgi:hypothetical protein
MNPAVDGTVVAELVKHIMTLMLRLQSLQVLLESKGLISREEVETQHQELEGIAEQAFASLVEKDQIEKLRLLLEAYDGPKQ